jgi:AbrB family looped-hinge helix DNA binding protein
MKNGSETTIDHAGRLVVPKSVRQQAGVRPGVPLRVSVRDGAVVIEIAPRDVRVIERKSPQRT